MAIKERINPKTGNKEYKCRYYYYKDGKKRDSETGWFNTKREAELQAERLKDEKELAEKDAYIQRSNKLLRTAFNEFIDEYEELANRDTTDNTCTEVSHWRRAKTIKSKYFPAHIQNLKVSQINPNVFREWLMAINDNDLAGRYIRSLKATLNRFNRWLRDNGYYADKNLDLDIEIALERTSIKPKDYKNREKLGERKVLSISEIEQVCDYFYDKGIEEFKNFYYYTLYYVLFYSGMRVEELIALQWKFIIGKEIYIENAINEREKRSNVYNRISKGIYHTKNQTSKRVIPIFNFYYELLVDYKNAFKYEFNLSQKEIEECFVFPKLNNHNPYEYQNRQRLTVVLQEALEQLNLGKTDCQMLRHSCATFLVLPYPEGLGYEENEIIDYFGHTDTEMLKNIYAKITKEQKSKRLQKTFSDYFTPDINFQQTDGNNTQTRLIERMKGDNPKAEEKRKDRIFKQINKAIERNQQKYGYLKKDKYIIESYIERYPDESELITFIEEE